MITGRNRANFRDVYDAFLAAGAAEAVDGATDLAEAAARLLADPALRAARQAAAGQLLTRYAGTLDRTFAHLEPLLPSPDDAERMGAD